MSDLIEQVSDKELFSEEVKLSTVLEPLLLEEDQTYCPVVHTFAPNLYIREVHLPAGSFVVGHYHTTLHQNIMLKGVMDLVHEDGSADRLTAPFMCTGQVGRKMAYIFEDVVWLNIFAVEDEEQDVEVLESRLMDRSTDFLNKRQNISEEVLTNRLDFVNVLTKYNLSREEVQAISENTADLIPLPYGSYKFKVSDSPIAGKGIFATATIVEGEVIGAARIKDRRTSLGRYLNHAEVPNAEMHLIGDTILLTALRGISGCFGGRDGEEITVNYADVIELNRKIAEVNIDDIEEKGEIE
jgi:hypothetical protein